MVMPADIGDDVADDQSNSGADRANEDTLGYKEVADLGATGAHRHEDSDVFGLLHHHHNERDNDIQRRDEYDKANGDEGDKAFQAQGVEKGLVLLEVVGGHEAL